MLPSLGSASYSLDGNVRGADLGAIAPYVGFEDQRVGGVLSGELHARGRLRQTLEATNHDERDEVSHE